MGNEGPKQTYIRVPQNKDRTHQFAFFTGTNINVKIKSDLPLIDAHMHIQSNNIAPIPVQYGVLLKQLIIALKDNPDIVKKILGYTKAGEIIIQCIFAAFLFNPITCGGAVLLKGYYNQSGLPHC